MAARTKIDLTAGDFGVLDPDGTNGAARAGSRV
jgi:hypothetical protein